jgi:hypothetical protein
VAASDKPCRYCGVSFDAVIRSNGSFLHEFLRLALGIWALTLPVLRLWDALTAPKGLSNFAAYFRGRVTRFGRLGATDITYLIGSTIGLAIATFRPTLSRAYGVGVRLLPPLRSIWLMRWLLTPRRMPASRAVYPELRSSRTARRIAADSAS